MADDKETPEPGKAALQRADEFLRQGIDLESDVMATACRIRDQSKMAYEREWLDARLMLLSILRAIQAFRSGIPGQSSQSRSDRLALITTFIQGVGVTESAISEGQYTKATAVLKQDYEILTRILEVKAQADRPGRTPNVRHAPEGSQHFYGQLNDVAHPSNATLISAMLAQLHDGDIHGLSHVPVFNSDTARSLYELHVWLILEVTRESFLLAFEMYPGEEDELSEPMRWFGTAISMLQKVGFEVTDKAGPDT
ncbi:MAG: hypothetical protein CMJ31_09120 [Phycisphaerae bacterium]|nr:hypothetical protein [Phycisphaerae bacterium]